MQQLDFAIETLEDLETPWDWGHFAAGVGTGIALVALGTSVALT